MYLPGLLDWPFATLEPGHYRVILCDPPWSFKTFSAKGLSKSPDAHYKTMKLDAIKALPVADLAHPDGCAMVMWATAPMLPEAFELMRAWGFTYRTAGAWGKQSKTGAKLAFGTGYWLRSAAEFTLWGARGKPPRQLVRNVRNLILAPVRENSRKPDQLHRDLERMFPGPRCELFARAAPPGWDVWGNETGKFQA